PPPPRTREDEHRIISGYCHGTRASMFVETGCAVCACLVPVKQSTKLVDFQGDLSLLVAKSKGVTRKERKRKADPETDIPGPVMDTTCQSICIECETALSNQVVPRNALSHHRWIGNVLPQLLGLSYAESVLIAKIRHSISVFRVASGRVKMSANVIMFTQPILKIYN
ncbi:hypothetical protein B0H11DRAFT_1695204, partial [Mycena galericulata]